MGSSSKIVNGIAWSSIVNLVNAVYGFVAVPILIRYFGKVEYGLIGLAMSVNVYMRLMDMGLNSTNVRFFSSWLAQNNNKKLKAAFQTSLSFYGFIGLVNCIILFVVAFFSKSIFNVTQEQDIILKNLFYILAVSAFCSWFSSCFDQMVKATEDIAWLQKRTLLTKILMIVVLFLTITCGLSIEWYYALTCLATLSIVPLSIKKIRDDLPFLSFIPVVHKDILKELLPYMLHVFSFSLFQFSFYNLRPVFLGIQGTIESVTDYRILNGIIGIVTTLGGAFMGILLPSSSKVVANNNTEAYYRLAYDGTKYISIMLCFCCFGMMSVGMEVLSIYVGTEYLYLIPWFNLWLFCTIGTHNQAISSLILAGSDIRAISYTSVVSSIIGLLLAWFLIPTYNIGGVCIAFAVYMLIQILFYYLYYWPKVMNINSWKVFSVCFFPYVIIGGCLALSVSCIKIFANIWESFFIKGLLFTLFYSIAVWFMLNTNDRQFVKTILKKK